MYVEHGRYTEALSSFCVDSKEMSARINNFCVCLCMFIVCVSVCVRVFAVCVYMCICVCTSVCVFCLCLWVLACTYARLCLCSAWKLLKVNWELMATYKGYMDAADYARDIKELCFHGFSHYARTVFILHVCFGMLGYIFTLLYL